MTNTRSRYWKKIPGSPDPPLNGAKEGIKVIAALLKYLPPDHNYKVIFMHRKMEEILRSQKEMLARRGEDTDKVGDEEMAALFAKHLGQITGWIAEQTNMDVLNVSYNDLLQDPIKHAQEIDSFLDTTLNVEQMVGVIDPRLYRQRG
jgi:hypothetical protein